MNTQYAIIGTGIAGMSAALYLATFGKVTLVTKKKIISGSTPLAQGGIAAVLCDTNTTQKAVKGIKVAVEVPKKNEQKKSDSFHNHILDTLISGHYKNNIQAVNLLVQKAPEVMTDLKKWGIQFAEHKHLEGGHSHKRIFHTGDTTGKSIAEGLQKKIREHSNITVLDNTYAMDIITNKNIATGVKIYTIETNTQDILWADKIVLATGGYASCFYYSTAPEYCTGDGIAMALRAGVRVQHLSNIQFHPTVLRKKRSPRLLLTEALRGSGAKIVDQHGIEFVDSLASRDIVSKAILEHLQKGNSISLDIRPVKNFTKKYPFVAKTLLQDFGLDATKEPIPIAPAAHYCMGGITTDLHGKTNIKNLYAAGECAYTGVHGSNRLASNSLLEGIVFAKQIASDIHNTASKKQDFSSHTTPQKTKNYTENTPNDSKKISIIQEQFSQYLGVIQNKKQIKKLSQYLETITMEGFEATNFLNISRAIVEDVLITSSSSTPSKNSFSKAQKDS